MERASVLILGGGVGGSATAAHLRRRLPKTNRIILVERQATSAFAPSLLWLMTGAREPNEITWGRSKLARMGVDVVIGDVQSIDPEGRAAVLGDGRTFAADHLVIALGADLAPEAIPGLAEAGHDLYTLAGAQGLRDALQGLRAGRLVILTATPAYKCPAAPYEAAMLIDSNLRKRQIRHEVRIDLYAAEPGPMGVAGPEVSAAVRAMVERKGIRYHPEHQVTRVDRHARRISFSNGAEADYDLLAYVPPHRAPAVVRESGLLGESGWVAVDRHTLQTRYAGVYAIGDVAGIPLKLGKPLPKAGVFAHGQAEVVARNIARAITGRGAPARFNGHGACFIETGDNRAGFGKGDFYAEPVPRVAIHKPSLRWHFGKVLFEKMWLAGRF